QEIADARAIIGRDGIGCEPASATTVAGIKRLVAARRIRPDERVVALLTGHLLKDTDYAIGYHSEMLYGHDHGSSKMKGEGRITGTYSNPPVRIRASKTEILDHLEHIGQDAKT
ncbi:MAG: threonine synthase, partial [Pyrinomonadaceae bacterium]